MTTGERIKELRQKRGIRAEDLAQKIGIDRSTLYRYEKGDVEKLPISALGPIAKALGTTPAYLMGWEEACQQAIEKHGFPYNPTHKIPILGYISAGLPLYAEEHIEGYTYTELNHEAEYFGLRVRGDSMNAANIHDGNILIVRRQQIVDDGKIAVVLIGNEDATVKRFYRDGHMVTLMPQSTNPAHSPQVYDARKISVLVLGQVVQSLISFD